jgi:hypothetical protein
MRTRFWFRPLVAMILSVAFPSAARALPSVMSDATVLLPSDNAEARLGMKDTIFAPVAEIVAHKSAVISQSVGSARVSFQVSVQDGAVFMVFANQRGNDFPVDGAGTYIIKRSLKDGSFLQAKIFVQNGPGSYVRLFPQGDRTMMDLFLLGRPFQSQIALPLPLDRLLTEPLSTIIALSDYSVNWGMMLAPIQSDGDRRIAQILMSVRARLRGLRDMDDGAMDASGKMVFIASGAPAGKGGFNCSGFAKWFVDGFYAPLEGHDTDIAVLKSRNAGLAHSWSARYEEELDPWFGLDWSRGLARAVEKARTGSAPTDAEIDVRDSDRVPYVTDTGYPVPDIEQVLYVLARKNPGTIYIGSVNAASALAPADGLPTLRQHHHVILLFPFFDAQGGFQVAVMERNVETSLSSLNKRYAKEYVHLERLGSDGAFALPSID